MKMMVFIKAQIRDPSIHVCYDADKKVEGRRIISDALPQYVTKSV